MSIEALKEQARQHEQNEQWEKALDLYSRAIDQMSEGDDPDVGLFNRSGDLATRIGRQAQAVTFYEKAVDFYVAAGLPNNAIAICKKVMRNLPDRYSIHLKMGQIRAAQGLVTEARSSFVMYAERVQANGDLDEAFRALVEFVELAPNDYEIRIMLASQLEQDGRQAEAVQQFVGAYHAMRGLGLEDEAREVEVRIRRLAPDTVLDGDSGAGGGGHSASDSSGAVAGSSATAAPTEGDEHKEASPLADLPLTMFYDEDDDEDAPVSSGETKEVAEVVEEQAVAEAAAKEEAAAQATEEQAAAQAAEEEAAAQAAEEEAAAQAVEELAAAQAAERESAAEVAEQEAPAQVAEESTAEASVEHEVLAAAGDLAGAIATLASLIASDPDEMSHHLRMVEYAFRLNDPSGLSNAYLGLAECLERSGQSDRAAGVFQQVLSTDPANERARQALGLPDEDEAPPEASSEPPSEAPSDDAYVDVGEILLGGTAEELTEKSTRFVVPYEEPTGDDQADFERMLSQFREKVAENIDPNDAMAHYDLGTAYMEMGLLDEAISEFQTSLRASPDHLPAYEMLGQTFMQKEEPEAALRSLTRALETPYEVEDELVAIYYYLGLAYETVGNKDSALEYYDRVFALDINFADVTQRLKSLRE